jgi:multiple sugar transport system permease protein
MKPLYAGHIARLGVPGSSDLRRLVLAGLRILMLGVVIVWTAFPIVFMVRASFKEPGEIFEYPPRFFSGSWSLGNYAEAVTPQFQRELLNSALSTGAGVIVTLLVSFAAAYVFARMRGGWLRLPAVVILTIRMFPPIVVLIPLFPAFNALGLLDTLTPLVLVGAAFAVSVSTLLLKAFIDDIPVELEEAALIDGCTPFEAFWRITLPLVAPGIAAVVVFASIGFWNEYLLPLVFTSITARTAPVAIAISISNSEGVRWGSLLAMSTLHLAPMLVLVMFLHKRLVSGMTMGAVKG